MMHGLVYDFIVVNLSCCCWEYYIDVEPILSTKYLVIRKNQFDKNNQDEEIQSVAKSFRVNYFLVVIGMVIISLKSIFEQLKSFNSIFGFF